MAVHDRDQLREAVEQMHGCSAKWLREEPVNERFESKLVWQGVVNIFEIAGHPEATRCYAWSSPIEGSDKRRFFAVLHQPPIESAQDAVRAAIVAEHKSGAR